MERQAKDGTIYQQVGPDSWSPVTRTAKDGTVYKKVGDDSWSPMQSRASTPSDSENVGILGAISKVGKALDSVTGAPVRAAIGAAQSGNNPLPAFASQFAADPNKAPTGHDIVKRAGLSDEHALVMTPEQMKAWNDQNARMSPPGAPQVPLPNQAMYAASPADVGGLAMDVAADPTMLIPGVAESKLGKAAIAKAGDAVGKVTEAAAKGLKGAAEASAVKATGATASQAAKFADGAGRELLDRGIVKFGDNAAKISERANDALAAAHADIDSSLKALDAKGVTVDSEKVQDAIRSKITELSKDPSKADIVKHLEGELENVTKASVANGSTQFPVSEAEQTKRGYSRKAGNWADPEKGQAGKQMYQAYREEVENAAKAADPALAEKFINAKETHALVAPIEEASSKRALVQNQSPDFNLKDIGAAAVGGVKGVLANRVIGPRLASSAAVTLDKTANALRAVPELAALETQKPAAFKAILDMVQEHKPSLPMVADKQPMKGPDKWANDGLNNLKEHAQSSDEKAQLEKLRGAKIDQTMKELLIRASDLKPGSKAMDKILMKLKSQKVAGDD